MIFKIGDLVNHSRYNNTIPREKTYRSCCQCEACRVITVIDHEYTQLDCGIFHVSWLEPVDEFTYWAAQIRGEARPDT